MSLEPSRASVAGASVCASVSLEQSRASVAGDGGGFDPCSDCTVASPRDSSDGNSESVNIIVSIFSRDVSLTHRNSHAEAIMQCLNSHLHRY